MSQDRRLSSQNMTCKTSPSTVVVPEAPCNFEPLSEEILEATTKNHNMSNVINVNEENIDRSHLEIGANRHIKTTPLCDCEGENDEIIYPKGIKLVLISLALGLAVFCTSLLTISRKDETIVATAIPKISDHFHRLNDVAWYGSSYLLSVASFQLIYGKLYTLLPIKWVFLGAVGTFEVGSLISGTASTSISLIVGRAISGLGCAGIISGALTIISHSVPLRLRSAYTGLVGLVYGIACATGPLLGGVFASSEVLTWRFCFYINLIFGTITIVIILTTFDTPKSQHLQTQGITWQEKMGQFDWLGTVLFIPGVVCLLLALQWGGTVYAWTEWRLIVLLILAVALLICFVAIQIQRQETATLPPRIIKTRSIAFGACYSFAAGAAFDVMQFYLPIWFQAIKGVSPVKSGIMLIPFILSYNVSSFLAGVLVSVLGYYNPFMIAGSILMAVGSGLITTFATTTGHTRWIGYLILFGLGQGFGLQQPLIVAQAALGLDDVPTGTAIMIFAQTLGGSLSISIGQNIFDNMLISGLTKIPNIDTHKILNMGATGLRNSVGVADLPAVLIVYNRALTRTWYVGFTMGSLSLLAALGIKWISVKETDGSERSNAENSKGRDPEK